MPTSSSSGAGATLGPPETTTLRISGGGLCDPTFYTAADYLLEEGFTDAKLLPLSIAAVARGEVDIGAGYSQWIVTNVDAGKPIVALAGIHTGCAEVWTRPGISTIGDLKGKTIAVNVKDVTTDVWYGFWAALLAYVGINPLRDVNFVEYGESASIVDIFLRGQSDATLALAGAAPLLGAYPLNIGKLLINTHEDRPWSQYYCCQIVANRDWARKNPNAARRVTRALLRANDRVAKDLPAAVRAAAVQGMFASPTTYDIALAVGKRCTFEWRDLDAQESLRFYALQLADQKLVKGSPQQLVAQASDFGYVEELKRQILRPAN